MIKELFVSMFMVVSSACAHAQVEDYLQYVPTAMNFALEPCGAQPAHSLKDRLFVTVAAWGITYGIAGGLKMTVHEWRPDDSDNLSFPSGHSIFAFAGATVLHKEFGHLSPWISVAGYSVATLTAVDRVCKDRHHWYDACAGAAIGFLSTELTYYVTDRLFPHRNASVTFTGNSIDVALRW